MKVYTMPVGTMGTNCYIVADGEASVVIDPGFQAEKLEAFLREKGLHPEYILLTHGHYDHIGAVRALREAFGCKLAVGRRDLEMLADRRKSLAIMRGMTDEDYLLTPDLLLGEGDAVTRRAGSATTAATCSSRGITSSRGTSGGSTSTAGTTRRCSPRSKSSRRCRGITGCCPATAPRAPSSGNAGTTPT